MNRTNKPDEQAEKDKQEPPLFAFDTPGAGWDEGKFDMEAEKALEKKQDGNE